MKPRHWFGPFFIFAGIMHFVIPKTYMKIMPDYLPRHRELVLWSGVAEIVGGAAVLHPKTRRFGSRFSIATLLGVYPANVHMALNPDKYENALPGGKTALYCRLPVQGLFIAWAHAARKD